MGAKFRRADLIEAVLEPSRQVVEGYRLSILALDDGRVLTGLVREESGESLRLVDAEAKSQRIPLAAIVERRFATSSLMPDGLAVRYSATDFADLIAYLESLKPANTSPAGGLWLRPGFRAETIATGLTGVTAMELAPDGRAFLCEQTGALRILGSDGLLQEPFSRLEVDSQWERGLLGVTFDPAFRENGYLYVVYVSPKPYPHHRVSRLTASGNRAIPGSELILLEGDDQRTLGGDVPAGHQGGAIHLARDGTLLIAIGDQTAGRPAQRFDTFQGKLLRIHRDGTIPIDNPFLKSTTGKYRAIWALGLRNPFTFAVQPETGRILINDVGGIAEEVNQGHSGSNYGWPAIEHGPTKESRFVGPIHHYPTSSITGGAFCPADPKHPFPVEFHGQYFFMDFIKGWIKTLDPERPGRVALFASGLQRPVDLKFAPDGSLLVLIRDAWVCDGNFRPGTGSVLRIRAVPSHAER